MKKAEGSFECKYKKIVSKARGLHTAKMKFVKLTIDKASDSKNFFFFFAA